MLPHQNVFVMAAAFICIVLVLTARHHPPSRRKIKEIWHGRVYWEGESNTTMLRSSEKALEQVELKEVNEISTNLGSIGSPPKIQPEGDSAQKTNTKTMIAICAATHSKSNWRSLDDTALRNRLIPSIQRTISVTDRSQYDFRLYLAADHDDQFWLNNQNNIRTPDWLSVYVGFYDVPEHKIPFNPMMRKAYNDGAEYMVRINDDSEFMTSDWVSKTTAKLATYDPPNVGMVGPNCREGNRAIMTHDMVHRTHLDIFEHYYPDVFSAWWIDDWISKVYGPQRSTKMMDWTVKHHTHEHGTRYAVQHHEKQLLSGELEKGRERIAAWLKKSPSNALLRPSDIIVHGEIRFLESRATACLHYVAPETCPVEHAFINAGRCICDWIKNRRAFSCPVVLLLPGSENYGNLDPSPVLNYPQIGVYHGCTQFEEDAINFRRLLRTPNVLAVLYRQSAPIEHPKLVFVPLGPSRQFMRVFRTHSEKRPTLYYVNHSPWGPRQRIFETVNKNFGDQLTNEFCSPTYKCTAGRRKMEVYWQRLHSARFVESPPGLGEDCYRHYEIMLAGAVPVVQNTMGKRLKGFPRLSVTSWSDVTPSMLQNARVPGGNLERLHKSYWVQLLKTLRKNKDIAREEPRVQTVVMAAAMNYGLSEFKNFVVPLRKVYTGDVILFVNANLPPDVVKLCQQHNIITRALPTGSRLGVKGNRYIGYSEVCNNYQWCFATDFRDVFFQENPFLKLPNADLILFEEDNHVKMGYRKDRPSCTPTVSIPCTCPYNANWIRTCWGNEFLSSITDESPICSGTIMGTPRGFVELKDKMLAEMTTTASKDGCTARDQGHLNYLYFANHLDVPTVVQLRGEGIVNTVGYITPRNAINDHLKGGYVVNKDNKVSAVVHQYDRFPELIALLRELVHWKKLINTPLVTLNQEMPSALHLNIVPKDIDGTVGSQADNVDKLISNTLFQKDFAGTFVEFGCSNGIRNSNSLLLEREHGWNGLCIEPNPFEAKFAIKNRKHGIHALISYPAQDYKYAAMSGHCAQGSGIVEFMNEWSKNNLKTCPKARGEQLNYVTIPGVNLETLLEENHMPSVTWISADCEGCEWTFIQNFDFDKYDVRVFSYETSANRETQAKIENLLTEKGFSKHNWKGNDAVYTRNMAQNREVSNEMDEPANRQPLAPFPTLITEDELQKRVCDFGYKTRKRNDLKNGGQITKSSVICIMGSQNILESFFRDIVPQIQKPFVIVTVEHDDSVPPRKNMLDLPLLQAWFGWNTGIEHPKLHPIPIGLNEGRHFGVIKSSMQKHRSNSKLNRVLVNFKQDRDVRKKLWKLSRDWSFADRLPYDTSGGQSKKNVIGITTDDSYYKMLSKYKYVACPKGLGIDTHRTWESLYMGAIPIVLKSSISPVYEGLPVIQLDRWEELNEELLFIPENSSYEKLDLDFWVTKILAAVPKTDQSAGIMPTAPTPSPSNQTLCIGIVAHKGFKTLENTLQSYRTHELYKYVREVHILFQQLDAPERHAWAEDVIQRYPELIPIYETKNIQNEAFFKLVGACSKSEFVMIVEEDFQISNTVKDLKSELKNALYMLNHGADAVRMRSRTDAGLPNYSKEGIVKTGKIIKTHTISHVMVDDHAENSHPEITVCRKEPKTWCTSSKYGHYTNNPVLYRVSFANEIFKQVPQDMRSFSKFEPWMTNWWSTQDFILAWSNGIFKHNRLDRTVGIKSIISQDKDDEPAKRSKRKN